ncbi:MAG: ATP-binding protein [Acutalibacteraceae bacterium]
MRFDGFAGNGQAKALLSAAVDSGRLPHALIVEGPRGSGKRLLAHLFAKAAVCTAEGERPCGVCAACRKAETGHPDITVLQGDGSAKSLSVATIRALREQAAILPNEAAYKVAIIADAGCMNPQAQNALLKILEEPPSFMLFVLTVENRAQLLPTVQSRCMCVSLLGVEEQEALACLREKLPQADEEELLTRIRLFSGCIGAVLSGMEDEVFARTVSLVPAVAAAIISPQEMALLTACAPLERDKPLTDAVLSGVRLVLRDALVLAAGGEQTVSVSPKTAQQLASSLTKKQLYSCIEVIEGLQQARRRNMNQTLLLTVLCARLRQAVGR